MLEFCQLYCCHKSSGLEFKVHVYYNVIKLSVQQTYFDVTDIQVLSSQNRIVYVTDLVLKEFFFLTTI